MTITNTHASPSKHWASGSRLYLHPQPRRMIQFIGGFAFGSFPALFYKRLAMQLCEQKRYSVVLHPFPFNPFIPDHWRLALDLYVRLRTLQLRDLPLLSTNASFYLQRSNHVWLGHSLGCKLIELLETLSLEPEPRRAALMEILSPEEVERIQALIDGTVVQLQRLSSELSNQQNQPASDGAGGKTDARFNQELKRQLTRRLEGVPPRFILDQPSLLMAPQISGATRLTGTSLCIYSTNVHPSWEQTCYLVRSQPSIFNLTDLIRFSSDTIAADDIHFLKQVLTNRQRPGADFQLHEVEGGHLRPLCPTPALLDAIEASIEGLPRSANP